MRINNQESFNYQEVAKMYEKVLEAEGLAPIDTQESGINLNRKGEEELYNFLLTYKPKFSVNEGLKIVKEVQSAFNRAKFQRHQELKGDFSSWFERIKAEVEREEKNLPF